MSATVHPDAAPGFIDGDMARIESELGELIVMLRFDARQRPDLVLLPKGGKMLAGRCVNTLIAARESDAGGCAAYLDTPVRLVSCEGEGLEFFWAMERKKKGMIMPAYM